MSPSLIPWEEEHKAQGDRSGGPNGGAHVASVTADARGGGDRLIGPERCHRSRVAAATFACVCVVDAAADGRRGPGGLRAVRPGYMSMRQCEVRATGFGRCCALYGRCDALVRLRFVGMRDGAADVDQSIKPVPMLILRHRRIDL